MLATYFENYSRYEPFLAPIQLVFCMLGMGATLTLPDLLRVVKRPQPVLLGAACQFVLTPLIAVLIVRLGNVDPGIAVGLVLISTMPSGSLSKLFAAIGGGNFVLSASLDAFGTLTSLVAVPILMKLLVSDYMPADFEMPFGLVVRELALFLLLPFFVGMAVARWLPRHNLLISKCCFCVGMVVVVVMVFGSVGSGRIRPAEYGWQAPLAIITFCLVGQQLSMMPFRLLGWPRRDRLSIGLDVTMRNINLALVLLAMMRETLLERQRTLGLAELDEGMERVLAGIFWAILYYAGVAATAGFIVAIQFRYAGPEQNSPMTDRDPPSPAVSGAAETQDVPKDDSIGSTSPEINQTPTP
jgi:BASS family bile acid:Na+ symporter